MPNLFDTLANRRYNPVSMFLPLLAPLLIAQISPPTFAWTAGSVKSLAPGVTLTQNIRQNPALLVDVLTIDPKAEDVAVRAAVSNDSLTKSTGNIRLGRESVTSLVTRKGLSAGVNADYFPYTGDPMGLGIMDGELYSEPYATPTVPGRAAIGFMKNGSVIVGIPQMKAGLRAADGTWFTIKGVDRLTSTTDSTDLVLMTPRFGPTSGARGGGVEIVIDGAGLPLCAGKTLTGTVAAVVSGSMAPSAIPVDGVVIGAPAGSFFATQLTARFHKGDKVELACNLGDITPAAIGGPGGSWNDVVQAVGGGPILLKGGKIIVDALAEGLPADIEEGEHARTSVGVRKDGKILIVTVDQATGLSAGLSLPDMAALLQQLGAVDAINLDGGGSTTMVANGLTVDYPTGGAYERPVADMLTVAADIRTPEAGDPPLFATPLTNLQPGQNPAITLTAGESPDIIDPHKILWNVPVGNIGYVTEDGILHVLRAGRGTITALVGGQKVSQDIVVGGPPPAAPVNPTNDPSPQRSQ